MEDADHDHHSTSSSTSNDASESDYKDWVWATGDNALQHQRARRRGRGRAWNQPATRGAFGGPTANNAPVSMSNVTWDGTIWVEIDAAASSKGPTVQQNILRETMIKSTCQVGHSGATVTAFNLLVDDSVLQNIPNNTEQEARHVLQYDSSAMSSEELNAGIAIYATHTRQ
jgi:hypothetical protein